MEHFDTGETKRAPKLTRWRPKRWQPEYDHMVILSVKGFSNIQIGEVLGYTKEHVSNVLNLQQAEELRENLQERIREQARQDIPNLLTKIAEKSIERLYMAVHNDELFEKSPFAVIDRGLEVLKGVGHLKHGNAQLPGAGGITVNGNAVFGLPEELATRLVEGMEKANEVRQLHPDESAAGRERAALPRAAGNGR